MALFGWLGNKKEEKEEKIIPWKILKELSELDEITENSKDRLIAIFKHSTRCGTSRMALRAFESAYDDSLEALDLYYLDLLSYRDISDEIAARFQVWHESPQLLLIKNGKCVHHSSHHSIHAETLKEFL